MDDQTQATLKWCDDSTDRLTICSTCSCAKYASALTAVWAGSCCGASQGCRNIMCRSHTVLHAGGQHCPDRLPVTPHTSMMLLHITAERNAGTEPEMTPRAAHGTCRHSLTRDAKQPALNASRCLLPVGAGQPAGGRPGPPPSVQGSHHSWGPTDSSGCS